ncbi:MAG: MarR family transcriptional regulator [Halieaceae bacterium]|jgi:DNA-binding MarR family transcriptional regulator|nr:MarR family transcriptional regulator [Halieaceae bacterium]
MTKSVAEKNHEIAYQLSNNVARWSREFAKDFESRILALMHERGHVQLRKSHSAVFGNLGFGAVRVTELAARAQITQQAMGKMLKELERIGWIARDTDGSDRRAREIRLTEKGLELIADSMLAMEEVRQHYAEKIGTKKLVQLESALKDVVQKLELKYLPESWLPAQD